MNQLSFESQASSIGIYDDRMNKQENEDKRSTRLPDVSSKAWRAALGVDLEK